MPRPHQMVGARLGSRIRRIGRIGSIFAKPPLRSQRAEDFVGRNMVKAESGFGGGVETAPILQARLKHHVGADEVGLDEGRRRVDGAIDMALRRQVHHPSRSEPLQRIARRPRITNIGAHE